MRTCKFQIKVLKPENNHHLEPLNWKETVKKSGGERSAMTLITIITLLEYSRSARFSNNFQDDHSSKLLILDNPFSKMQSDHIIEAIMEVANATDTQLMIFSGIKLESVLNPFPICVGLSQVEIENDKKMYLNGQLLRDNKTPRYSKKMQQMTFIDLL